MVAQNIKSTIIWRDTLLCLLPFILWGILCGLFANKLFLRSLQKKCRRGYHLLPKYKTTDCCGAWMLLSSMFSGIAIGGMLTLFLKLDDLVAGALMVIAFSIIFLLFHIRTIIVCMIDFVRAKRALTCQLS